MPSFAAAARFWIRLGFISFGGPAGQIAIIHREVVVQRRWVDERQFADALNFCMLLPGPEALQLAKIGRRALGSRLHLLLAVASFLALTVADVPFPWILVFAAAAGLAQTWRSAPRASPPAQRRTHSVPTLAWGLALWVAPLLAVAATLGVGSLWGRLYLFFTRAALVTFGGAYAVLGYVTQHFVHELGWLTAEQSVAGLALAETTPGPLVIVLQFTGFMVGWNQPAPLSPATSAVLAALLTAWATFLPSFVLIILGAPYVERLTHEPRIAGALAAITAAVVGIIATLALLLARVVLFPAGLEAGPHWASAVIAAVAGVLLVRSRVRLPWVLAATATAGLLLQ